MDKQFMLFSKRKELAEEYEKWVNTPLEDGSKIKDCTLSVITFMQTKGYRKSPENAVVLTDKRDIQQYEWSKLVDKMGVIEFGEKIRKETAEKFALKLADYFVENCGGRLCLSLTLQEWYKMIDEIRKEITEERK